MGRHREDDITIPSTVSLWWSFPANSSTVSTLSPRVVFVDEYREVEVLKRGLRVFIFSICPSWRPKSELVCCWVWGILHVVCLFCCSSFCYNVHFVNNGLFPLNLEFQKIFYVVLGSISFESKIHIERIVFNVNILRNLTF